MVSLGRLEEIYSMAFEAAQDSERTPQDINDRRRLERDNRLLNRQLRSVLIATAYSLSEAAIIGLTCGLEAPAVDVNARYGLATGSKPSKLYKCRYKLQHTVGICNTDQWDEDWNKLHRLGALRHQVIHEGGLGEESKLTKALEHDDGNGVWIEPMFEGVEAEISVLVVGDMHFRQWMQRLQKFIFDIDAEFPKHDTT